MYVCVDVPTRNYRLIVSCLFWLRVRIYPVGRGPLLITRHRVYSIGGPAYFGRRLPPLGFHRRDALLH